MLTKFFSEKLAEELIMSYEDLLECDDEESDYFCPILYSKKKAIDPFNLSKIPVSLIPQILSKMKVSNLIESQRACKAIENISKKMSNLHNRINATFLYKNKNLKNWLSPTFHYWRPDADTNKPGSGASNFDAKKYLKATYLLNFKKVEFKTVQNDYNGIAFLLNDIIIRCGVLKFDWNLFGNIILDHCNFEELEVVVKSMDEFQEFSSHPKVVACNSLTLSLRDSTRSIVYDDLKKSKSVTLRNSCFIPDDFLNFLEELKSKDTAANNLKNFEFDCFTACDCFDFSKRVKGLHQIARKRLSDSTGFVEYNVMRSLSQYVSIFINAKRPSNNELINWSVSVRFHSTKNDFHNYFAYIFGIELRDFMTTQADCCEFAEKFAKTEWEDCYGLYEAMQQFRIQLITKIR